MLPAAVQTIADHTKGFIKRVASALLGVVLGVLVGNLPQKLAAKFKEVVKGTHRAHSKTIPGSCRSTPPP